MASPDQPRRRLSRRNTCNHLSFHRRQQAGPQASPADKTTSGGYQAGAQLEDRSRCPLVVSLGQPTALVPQFPQSVLPATAEVDTATTTAFHWEHFTPQLQLLLLWDEGMPNIPPTSQTRTHALVAAAGIPQQPQSQLSVRATARRRHEQKLFKNRFRLDNRKCFSVIEL